MKVYEYHVWSLWFQIVKSYWTVIQPRLARRTWKRFIWPIQLTRTFSSAQYVKCKPTIFRACIGILPPNIPLLVNTIVPIVVKSLPIVFTWENTYLIVVILTNFLVNKMNKKWVLILHLLFQWIILEGGNRKQKLTKKLRADLRKYSGRRKRKLTYLPCTSCSMAIWVWEIVARLWIAIVVINICRGLKKWKKL